MEVLDLLSFFDLIIVALVSALALLAAKLFSMAHQSFRMGTDLVRKVLHAERELDTLRTQLEKLEEEKLEVAILRAAQLAADKSASDMVTLVAEIKSLELRQEEFLTAWIELEERVAEERVTLEQSASQGLLELELTRVSEQKELLAEEIEQFRRLRRSLSETKAESLSGQSDPLLINSSEEEDVEPTVLVGLIGSIASIIGLIQQNKENLSIKTIVAHFRERESEEGSPEYEIGQKITDEDLEEQASILLAIYNTDKRWLDRITNRCIEPLNKAIDDHDMDETDLEEQRSVAATCVCANIKMARDDNGGKFPSEEFKKLWARFKCS